MSRKEVLQIGALVACLLVCLCVYLLGSYLEFKNSREVPPTRIKRARPAGWKKLRPGLTKKEVVQLIGDSESKGQPVTIPKKQFVFEGQTYEMGGTYEIWEYNWSYGRPPDVGACAYAWTVKFGKDGKLAGFNKPEKKPSLWFMIAKPTDYTKEISDK